MYSHQWECSELSGYRLRFIWSFSVLKRSQRFILTMDNGVTNVLSSLGDLQRCDGDCSGRYRVNSDYQPKILAKMSGATIVASDSIMNFGVSMFSFPQVIFSLGTAPEYEPKLVVESLI